MKRYSLLIFLAILFSPIHAEQYAQHQKLKVLHLSFHQGCINDFQEVARELDLDLTSWYILAPHLPRNHFDGRTTDAGVYNMTYERASWVWERYKAYFEQFDAIVTSDTAPLSRIFLQHDWHKPLIIWVCNRFDYADWSTAQGKFPDTHYYRLFQEAVRLANVRIISYTPYEHFYAQEQGINWGTFTIKPIGVLPSEPKIGADSRIPAHVDRANTIFINPRLSDLESKYAQLKCMQRGITTYTGVYNGPDDLYGFKGILYFPYAWSNLALFENLQRGFVHFVPTFEFVMEAVNLNFPVRFFTYEHAELCEWYAPEYKDLFVYFDSWEDLAQKIQSTDYVALKKRIVAFAQQHRTEMLARWQMVFDDARRMVFHKS